MTDRSKDAFEKADEVCVLSGIGTGNMLDSMQVFEMHGVKVYAATDGGGRKSKQTEELYNHDRVVIRPSLGRMAVLDGAGDEALSSVLADVLLQDDSSDVVETLTVAMNLVNRLWCEQDLPASMASLIAADLDENNSLSVAQAGDTGALIVSKNQNSRVFTGGAIFTDRLESDGQIKRKVSSKNALTDDWSSEWTQHYYPELAHGRSVEDQIITYKKQSLASGDMVLLFSDVIWKNFSVEELTQITWTSRSAKECFARISNQLDFRFRISDTTAQFCSDLKPKQDNQSLVVFQI